VTPSEGIRWEHKAAAAAPNAASKADTLFLYLPWRNVYTINSYQQMNFSCFEYIF